jgi:hypothetical protein
MAALSAMKAVATIAGVTRPPAKSSVTVYYQGFFWEKLTGTTLRVGDGLITRLDLNNVRLRAVHLCLSETNLLIFEIVHDVRRAQEGVSQNSDITPRVEDTGEITNAEQADAAKIFKDLAISAVISYLLLDICKRIDDHLVHGDGDVLARKFECEFIALALGASPCAVNKRGLHACDGDDAK